jgi:hypothetical protein
VFGQVVVSPAGTDSVVSVLDHHRSLVDGQGRQRSATKQKRQPRLTPRSRLTYFTMLSGICLLILLKLPKLSLNWANLSSSLWCKGSTPAGANLPCRSNPSSITCFARYKNLPLLSVQILLASPPG